MIAVFWTSTVAFAAFSPLAKSPPAGSISPLLRSRPAVAFIGPDEEPAPVSPLLYKKTPNGLTFKDLKPGDGRTLEKDEIVTLSYTATAMSSGNVVEVKNDLTFILGDRMSAPAIFEEAIAGMTCGAKRLVNVPPSSIYSLIEGETIQFEVEVVGVQTGLDALAFRLGPDILRLFGAIPPYTPPLVDASNAWAA